MAGRSGQPRIRRATVDDAGALAEIAARTFHDTFAADNEPADMEEYLRGSFSEARVERELAAPESLFLLAFAGSGRYPVGYAKLRVGEPDPSVSGSDAVEIERLYVAREALGQGIGAALMQSCLEEAVRGGHRTVWLGVWERNERAIAFYRRWGFEEVGSHRFQLGSDPQNDLVMERPVTSGGGDRSPRR